MSSNNNINLTSTYRCHMGLEKGGQEYHLYVPSVMDIFSKPSNKINNDLKTAMKGLGGTLPPRLYVCVRQLTGIGMHTFLGSLGYCQKYQFKDHYKMHQVGNIIPTPVVDEIQLKIPYPVRVISQVVKHRTDDSNLVSFQR